MFRQVVAVSFFSILVLSYWWQYKLLLPSFNNKKVAINSFSLAAVDSAEIESDKYNDNDKETAGTDIQQRNLETFKSAVLNPEIITKKSKNGEKMDLKKILLWNTPDRIEVAIFGTGHQPFIDQGCPITNCYIEVNSSEFRSKAVNNFEILKSFDAILINIGAESWLSFLPKYERPPGQRLVWLSQESPQYLTSLDPNKHDGMFNWTMTYQRDSDIKLLFGRIERVENQTSSVIRANRAKEVRRESNRAALSKKSKTVAWMVSHCDTHSHREDYVRHLQNYIQVDVYGKCGNLSCPRNEEHWISNPECYDMIEKKYKFYLSFENSICNDYVTEKFFSVLQKDVVPIVFGGADYQSIAPNHSYIDAMDFSSPAKLAEYLHLLDKNDELYLDFLEWKSDYRVEAGVEQMARHAFCDLCAKLNREDEPKKVYDSMVPMSSASTQCRPGWTSN